MARRTLAPFAAGTVGSFYLFAAMTAMKVYRHFITPDRNNSFAELLAPKMVAYTGHDEPLTNFPALFYRLNKLKPLILAHNL